MYGAILGDIIGSRFEFDRGDQTKEFELFTDRSEWTDDTVMTIAITDALFRSNTNESLRRLKKKIIKYMVKWGNKYPSAGYGKNFLHWLEEPIPYNSYGNGAAMRVSFVGWRYDSLEKTRKVARLTAEVSHNHPEGIKGADCIASVIYLARTGSTKDEIRTFVINEFGYDISKTLEELRPLHKHIETCMDSVPKALISFFEGESFEDVIRNAISLGGDTDTIGAIAGSLAEAYYGVPEHLKEECKNRIDDEDMLDILTKTEEMFGNDFTQKAYKEWKNFYLLPLFSSITATTIVTGAASKELIKCIINNQISNNYVIILLSALICGFAIIFYVLDIKRYLNWNKIYRTRYEMVEKRNGRWII